MTLRHAEYGVAPGTTTPGIAFCGDLPVLRTVGVVVVLPDADVGAQENAVRHDVATLIDGMSELSRRAGIEFVVEYREEAVGFVDGGVGDARFVAAFFGDG